MKVTMDIRKGEFVNDKGEKLEYVQGLADVMGEPVRFVCKKEDKTLLAYLLKGQELEKLGAVVEEVE